MFSISNINELLIKNNLNTLLRIKHKNKWLDFQSNLSYMPLDYDFFNISYHYEYYKGNNKNIYDISFIVLSNNKPIAVITLFCMKEESSYFFFSNNSSNILPPLFSDDCPSTIEKNISKSLVNFFLDIKKDYRIELKFCSIYTKKKLINFYFLLFKYKKKTNFSYELFVNLDLNISEIKNSLRKSYKSLVVNKTNNLELKVLENNDISIWNEFRNLHLEESGRKTRSDLSWELQFDRIKNNNAFLIYINYKNNFISGAYFPHTNFESYYGVGVYPKKFNIINLGHLIQFRAIEEMKKRRIKKYKVGFIDEIRSEKRKSIDDFQSGFANEFKEKFIFYI